MINIKRVVVVFIPAIVGLCIVIITACLTGPDSPVRIISLPHIAVLAINIFVMAAFVILYIRCAARFIIQLKEGNNVW